MHTGQSHVTGETRNINTQKVSQVHAYVPINAPFFAINVLNRYRCLSMPQFFCHQCTVQVHIVTPVTGATGCYSCLTV